jgi:hypothetical protein
MASCKLKPSVKQYKKNARGQSTGQYHWVHYTVSTLKTEELKSFYTNPSYSRKKNIILRELEKRNVNV